MINSRLGRRRGWKNEEEEEGDGWKEEEDEDCGDRGEYTNKEEEK